MADAAVGFLSDNLGRLLMENVQLISDVKGDVEDLQDDLKMLKAFLEDAVEECRELEVVKVLMTQIRKLTFELEDAIDNYVYEAAIYNAKPRITRVFTSGAHALALREVAGKAKIVKAAVEKVKNEEAYKVALQRSKDRGQDQTEKKSPVIEEDNVVGFEGPAKTLIEQLTDEADQDRQVISIIGMPGLGKTTLANMVYKDPGVVQAFSTRAWIYLSQPYSKKNLLISILESGNEVPANPEDEKSLVRQVHRYLTWKYLIVLDDVCEPNHWDVIRDAFPNCRNGSRILITSRYESVGRYANLLKPPYKLNFLSNDQSWELLQFKAFGQKECPQDRRDLISLGQAIAKKCNGLPLALVVIGGLLQTKKSKDQWEIVNQSVNAQLFTGDKHQQCKKMLDLSYDHLPLHLKACFLYFGVFPKEFEIPVWILIRLWIAERFVQNNCNATLEKVAEDYLGDLAARNLVLVVERGFRGQIKTCRVYGVLHDLCVKRAQEESFLYKIKANTTTVRSDEHRRICIHSDVLKCILDNPCGHHTRSFLCFTKDQVLLPRDLVQYMFKNSNLLRTYHVQPITFHRFPNEIQKLVHLTYVAFSGDFTIIPAVMSKLWNLQTLIAHTTSRAKPNISIQADILKMSQFRHLHTNKPSQLLDTVTKKGKESDNASSKSIQTLNTITPESCTMHNLGQTPGIKKLGICGKLMALADGRWSLFDNLTNLQQLVTLKLFNDVQPDPPSAHKLQRLPQWDKFPPNLERLTLKDTFLDWAQMYVLGMLPNLVELKLKDNAFTGVRWVTGNGGFKKLRALQIWKTNLEFWEAKEEHFPRLEYLFLKDCANLEEVPSSLGNVETLRTIKLHRTSPYAATSVRRIKKRQQERKGLKIEIFPPDLGQASSPDDY